MNELSYIPFVACLSIKLNLTERTHGEDLKSYYYQEISLDLSKKVAVPSKM